MSSQRAVGRVRYEFNDNSVISRSAPGPNVGIVLTNCLITERSKRY